jgi:hypothetical protein
MEAEKIKKALLENKSPDGEKRKAIICLSTLGLVDFSIISLYQTGSIKSLPDLPFCGTWQAL